MSECDIFDLPCDKDNYRAFDDVAISELNTPPSLDEIVNHSDFIASISLEHRLEGASGRTLSIAKHFTSLKGKIGLYQFWIEIDHCDTHDLYHMLCVYVGKGKAQARVIQHLKDKWPEQQLAYVSFYECENRIAKYLEQLMLDKYDFFLNTAENFGTEALYGK